ncbi:ribonuclease H-like domain-containing protein, partial [Tanacetum coccineum]
YMHQPPGFVKYARADASFFIYHIRYEIVYLLLYVDDIILTALSTALLQRIIAPFHVQFAKEIFERAHMQNYNPCKTPNDTESKIGPEGATITDPTLYRRFVGALQYLTFTRTDLSYDAQQVCLYMHDPQGPHLLALKRILRYICGTLDHGLQLHASLMTQLVAYTDADCAGCLVTCRSTSGYCVFLGDNLLSCFNKRQVTLSCSTAEAEYRG